MTERDITESGRTETTPPFHAQTVERVLTELDTSVLGLDADEAASRREKHGPNRLPQEPRPGPIRRFLAQFQNILIYVLLGSAAVSAILGEVIDASVILLVVLINAVVGFIQEGKAERALEAIRDMLAPAAAIRRDGHRETIPAEDLVPGDLVLLKAGDRVPADLRLVETESLEIQESALTGESLPVAKGTDALDGDAALADRINMAYAGTLVVQGFGAGTVTETGGKTELGRITGMIAGLPPVETPLMRQLEKFAGVLTFVILALAGAMALFGWAVQDFGARDMFMAAVALAVAAIPEGLPAIMTIALAIGVTRMVRRNAIIRRLPAVETLGAVSVICCDKTGTLTQNRLTVEDIVTVDGTDAVKQQLLRAGLLCNDGEADWHGSGWTYHGNPTDSAFLAAAVGVGFDPAEERAAHPRHASLPFDSRRKFMATRHLFQDRPEPTAFLVLKGAPERVLDHCAAEADGSAIDTDGWKARIDALAAEGRRVLAVAWREVGPEHETGYGPLSDASIGTHFRMLGLVGLIDPPREEASPAVAECHAAGIRVKMITGDHAATARSIAGSLGIGDGTRALSGPEIDAMDGDTLRRHAADCDVFARTTPEHKLRLVEALQADGRIVAMTGDGVNDAPALKRADIGTAMGANGTEAAKEAADMVLADDNFASIAAAVEEGRVVYDNIRKSILFILPTSFGWSFVILAAVLAGQILPVTPAQILWVNMIATVTLALALAFEPSESAVMARPPRDPAAPMLDLYLLWRTLYVAVLMVAASYGAFLYATAAGTPLAEARTLAVTVLVVCDCAYILNARRLNKGLFARGLWRDNKLIGPAILATIVLQAGFSYIPALQSLFGSAALPLDGWLIAAGAAFAVSILVEVEFQVWKRLRRN